MHISSETQNILLAVRGYKIKTKLHISNIQWHKIYIPSLKKIEEEQSSKEWLDQSKTKIQQDKHGILQLHGQDLLFMMKLANSKGIP